MAQKTLAFLKNSNRNFNNILDSFLNLKDGGSVVPDVALRRNDVVLNGDANLNVTEALHAGRTIFQSAITGNKTYSVATPSSAGVHYHFVGEGTGAAAEAQEIIIDFADDAVYFQGVLTFLDTGNAISAVWADESSNDRLTINNNAAYDIHLYAKSTTIMYIWGNVTSANAPQFADQD
tara:strand:+ start:27 stop:560 length:534 start_codon:yes stop_codon:yes gene_type:complete